MLFDLAVNTEVMEELIFTMFEGILSIDLKELNLDYLGELLTVFAPVWNPIWAAINEWLGAFIGL
jgi:hypothetical protein